MNTATLPTRIAAVLVVLAAAAALPAQSPPGKLNKEKLDKLFKGIKLPDGDPNPDFVEREWRPTNPDPSEHNKRGTDYGPCLSFTVQLDKTTFVRRGLTVRLPGNRAALYDLDNMALAATWSGGFLDLSKTHFEELKGNQPGRPGGAAARWALGVPGWAGDGAFALPPDLRQEPALIPQVDYHGHFLHGFHLILSYSVLGRAVLEMPGADESKPGVSRTFHLGAGERPVLLGVLRGAGGAVLRKLDGVQQARPPAEAAGQIAVVRHKDGSVQAAVAVQPPGGSRWVSGFGTLALEMPASKQSANFKVLLYAGDAKGLAEFEKAAAASSGPMDLRNWVRGGPARWKTAVTTAGATGPSDRAYTVDALTVPADNPWKSWLRPSAIDFLSDGRLAVASMNGDVWLVSGIDATLKKLTWKRIATGLYEPLGLRVVKDKIHVLGRDRITRLHDLDGDGEADYYESFHHGGSVAPGYHAFAFDLQTDSAGNFYFVKSGRKVDKTPGHNAVIKVTPDGKGWEVLATGFRHPNGMGVGPKDEIVVSDNQGEFVPASKVSLIRKGGFYGYGPSKQTWEPPLFWLPMKEDNSSGGQFWAGKKWGPLSGKMLHTSYGMCKLFYVVVQGEGKPVQATVVPFELPFKSGIMRGRVNPVDGQVYVAGLRGWQTEAKADGSIERVRWTGKGAPVVEDVRVAPGGLRLRFSGALDPEAACDVKNYRLEQWNYIFSAKYGSPEMSVRNPSEKGRDAVEVKAVRLNWDRRTVTLEVPGLAPVNQLRTTVSVRAADGSPVRADLYTTLHRLPEK